MSDAVALPSAPIRAEEISTIEFSGRLKPCPVFVFGYVTARSRSWHDATLFPAKAAPYRFDESSESVDFAILNVVRELAVSAYEKTWSKYTGRGVSLPSVPMACDGVGASAHDAKIAASESKPMRGMEYAIGKANGMIAAREAAGVSAADAVYTGHFAVYVKLIPEIFGAETNNKTENFATVNIVKALNVAARSESVTDADICAVSLPSVPIVCASVGASAHDAVIVTPEAEPIRVAERIMSADDGAIAVCEAAGISAAGVSSTVRLGACTKALPAYGVAASMALCDNRANIDSAWWPPVWVDSGLYIRQSHNVAQNENGELVIM